MSSRARRVDPDDPAARFAWGGPPAAVRVAPLPVAAWSPLAAEPEPLGAVDEAATERDAFTKGYAQGERAGAEAAASRADAMLRRLAQTLDELQALRATLIHRTEREVVELSLAIARKVLHREVALDHELMLAMARVALDRLADVATASIRLHPDDFAVTVQARGSAAVTSHGVQIVSDASVRRGGCVVQSEFGSVDVGIAAQIDELTQALLGDAVPAPAPAHAIRRDDAA
jgi:flagellar assembly protein FliH